MKSYLMITKFEDDDNYYPKLFTLSEMCEWISMSDCYPEVDYELYMVKEMEMIHIRYTGWQPMCKMEFIDDEGNVVATGYGVDH